MTASLDLIGADRRQLVGDAHARARSAFPSPILSGAVGLATLSQVAPLLRVTDLTGIGAVTPSWASVAVTTALQAQLDQTRHLRPGILAAMTAIPVHPVWAFAELSGQHFASPALAAIRAQSALATRPLFAELCRIGTGLSAARTETLTRGLADLVEHPDTALADHDADEVVALLERDDADEQLVGLDAMHDAVLDVVDSEPVAELLDHVDLDRLADIEQNDRAALDEQTTSSLARLRARLSVLPKGHVAALVLSSTTLTGELLLDPPEAVTIETISPYLTLPLGILAVHGCVAALVKAAQRRNTHDQHDDDQDS